MRQHQTQIKVARLWKDMWERVTKKWIEAIWKSVFSQTDWTISFYAIELPFVKGPQSEKKKPDMKE